MLMKVFNKGQIVIPIEIRRELGVEPGDMMEVILDPDEHCIKLRKPVRSKSLQLAGSLSEFNKQRAFPTKKEMRKALEDGFSDGR